MDRNQLEILANEAVLLARRWQEKASGKMTPGEKRFHAQMANLLDRYGDKTALRELIDRSFRSNDPGKVGAEIRSIFTAFGTPQFFKPWEKFLIKLFLKVGHRVPRISVPLIIRQMEKFSRQVIITGEQSHLDRYLRRRRKQKARININHLGEAVLGEEEAADRLRQYIADLKNPMSDHISVKISTIYSQIQPLAFDHTVDVISERLSMLYRTAKAHEFIYHDGGRSPKFVYLDMEEFRDLSITAEAFMKTLNREEFKDVSAGIALQAYLPDSFAIQKQMTRWAATRVSAGGAPVKIRLVKGANLEMEKIQSSINGWPLAPFDSKQAVDTNFKRMVIFGTQPQNMKAARLGIASHNIFEIAFAYLTAKQNDVLSTVQFEMLAGMADHVSRVIRGDIGDILMYAPYTQKEQFISAIAYLIRRLDENTAPENFLRYASQLKVDSTEWRELESRFLDSCTEIDMLEQPSHKIQNRSNEVFKATETGCYTHHFRNAPDTDWSLRANQTWAEEIRRVWKKNRGDSIIHIPLIIGGMGVEENREIISISDPSRFPDEVMIAEYSAATIDDAARAVKTAVEDQDNWRKKSYAERHEVLSRVSIELRKSRSDLIGAAMANTGKVMSEADVEVSEAIDFAELYPLAALKYSEMKNLTCEGKGVGLVLSPWNFPIAIPAGGILASLAAGNTVILKPSSDAVLVAWELCQVFWRAGVPETALQLLPGPGATVGEFLITHPDIDFIILTGGTETARHILSRKPDVYLSAETGGKNGTIVSSMSDRDQAIADIVYSAFGNCGQKCSATSLLVLEKEVYDDPKFRRQLVDAARSLPVGSVWDFQNKLGPLINPPDSDLFKAMTTLEPGESWALEPRNIEGNPYLWTPGIKWDVTPGSYTHQTEFFGPLLAVIRADNIDDAVRIVNQTRYGLTSGIESLNHQEIERWKKTIEAGNLYINRGTTGAVTLRQPFGGYKDSAFGAGIKAGFPLYVTQFMTFTETGLPDVGPLESTHPLLNLMNEWETKIQWNGAGWNREELNRIIRAVRSYFYWMESEYSKESDYFHLRGQDNIIRFQSIGTTVVRGHRSDSLFDVLCRIAAINASGGTAVLSLPEEMDADVSRFLDKSDGKRFLGKTDVRIETDTRLIMSLSEVARLRYASPERVPPEVLHAAAKTGVYIARSPVLANGAIELVHYIRAQSVCHTYHRYGNLGQRESEYRL